MLSAEKHESEIQAGPAQATLPSQAHGVAQYAKTHHASPLASSRTFAEASAHQALVDADFGKRIMFGSDQMIWPEVIERSIEEIEQPPFLSAGQKREILHNDPARLLMIDAKTIARHNAM